MTKTLITLFLWAAAAWLMGSWAGESVGWILLTLGMLCMILVSARQLSQITRWTHNLDDPPPPSVGPWDNILAVVYRKLRRNQHDLAELNRHVDGIMLAAEALPDGAITLNEEMQVTWCNNVASEHTGLELSKDRGFSIFNIMRAPEFATYARQSEWREPLLLHTSHDGQERALLVQLTRYGSRQFLIVSRDVTQMEKLETTRKDFVANVSHELRTPLTVLSGFLETVHDLPADSLSSEQREHYYNLMMQQASRMQALVDDLLTLSTLESSPSVSGTPIRVAPLIESALRQAKLLSKDQHVFVENIDPHLHVNGIEAELASAISNLLTNAVRYTPKDGTITVSWYKTESGKACYSVQDTGIGIAAPDIPRLTERFYRVDRGRSRSTGGTGLGLAITKHVAMRHGAELHIRSRLGAGSTFSLDFPPARVTAGSV